MIKLFLCSLIFMLLNYSLIFSSELTDSNSKFKVASDAVKSKKYKFAINLFEELANDAEHDAQFNLAVLQKSGLGKPQDYKLALKWAWLASLGEIEQADEIVNQLKKILPDSTLTQVRTEVKVFLKQRADTGNFPAIKQMGQYYLIVPDEPEYKQAYLWFLVAAAFQIDGSVEKRDKIEKEIESKDVIAAQANAAKVFEDISFQIKNKIK